MAVPHQPVENRRFVDDGPDVERLETRAPLDTMPTGAFTSSNVHSGLYDFGERQLFMRYLRTGPDAIYQYWDVPASEWQGLKQANSKGSYINANVAYEYTYSLTGPKSFPERHEIQNDFLRRFVYDP